MDREQIEQLIGSELAAAVAAVVMGWHAFHVYPHDSQWARERTYWQRTRDVEVSVPTAYTLTKWRPDQNIAQAFEVIACVKELQPGEYFSLDYDTSRGVWYAGWHGDHGGPLAFDPDPATAISRACLLAMEGDRARP